MDSETRRAFAMGLGYGLGVCFGLALGSAAGSEARAALERRRDARVFLPTAPGTRVELEPDGRVRFLDPPTTKPTDRMGDPTQDQERVATEDGD